MVQEHYTTKRKKGKHLTLCNRGKIEAYLKIGMKKRAIAAEIGISERTLYREIKRGLVKGLKKSDLSTYDAYCAETAQRRYDEKQKKKEGELKIGKNIELMSYLEESIKKGKNSPYAALEKAKKAGMRVNICEKTLYNYIHSGLFIELTSKDLPYKKDRRKKERKEKRIRKEGGRSIEERSEEINNREKIGHWEWDTVLGGKGSKECLAVGTERKTRYQKIIKLKSKRASCFVAAIQELVKKEPKLIKSITSDNGGEFMDASSIEKLSIMYFYAHTYSSWERGSNENNNKLIRRYIPKGKNISEVSESEIKEIEEWMNNYPRKLFNGKSSAEMYAEELEKLS